MNWVTILLQLIGGMSPEVRAELKAGIDKMAEKAKATKLPFDDIAVAILRMVTGL